MKTTYKITGQDAIRLAERDNLTIHCYGNPIEPDGGIVNADVALEIAKEDCSLIYVEVQFGGWRDGSRVASELPGYHVDDYFGRNGIYLGPDNDGVEPRWNDAQ